MYFEMTLPQENELGSVLNYDFSQWNLVDDGLKILFGAEASAFNNYIGTTQINWDCAVTPPKTERIKKQ